jgi:ligand-binding sensor domain-containing protein
MKTKLISGIWVFTLFLAVSLKGQTFTNFTTSNGLPDNNVTGVASDKNNVKWFATQAGVARYNDTNWTVYTTTNGLVNNVVNCIAVDAANRIWAGTDYGVSVFDGTTWTTYTTTNGLANNMVNYIAGGVDGTIWFATNAGLSKFDGTTWSSYTTANGLPNDMVSYIAIDPLGNKWIGTWIGGLAKFDGTTFTTFTTADSLLDNNIISIAIDHLKNKWIGTFYGATVLDSNNHFKVNYRKGCGLYNEFVQDLSEDSKGTMWFGLYADYLQDGGITKLTGTTWNSYTVANGLVNRLVHKIAIDQKDYIWIATGSGVSKLVDKSDGVQGIFTAGNVVVYPNPATDRITLSGITKSCSMTIYDLAGSARFSGILQPGTREVGLGAIAPGIYFLRITEGDNTSCTKLIIK